ncbi:MAG: amino acid permease [Cytophagales bacterium]|nr:amino acid permease [Cytophagales bacterium]
MFNILFRKKYSLADESTGQTTLEKKLGFLDLTALGIAAIVGAGIFSTIGICVSKGGTGVVFLFIFTAISCLFSALCYAQFASHIPTSGSAYTYAYHSFGEIVAWIIGWDLFMEYAVSNIAVAISWSDYLSAFVQQYGILLQKYLVINGQHIRLDWPAFIINIFITTLCYIGIKESKNMNNIWVVMKLLLIGAVIAVSVFYIDTALWLPLFPAGLSGVLFGVSSVFFAYIGFDAITTTAEECINPQKDIPRAIIASLIISTLIYIALTLVVSGMVHYSKLEVGDPLSFIFVSHGMHKFAAFISLISLVTLSGVMLVYQLGQPRIWMAMSRDGLLPSLFSKIHTRFKTPYISTVITGVAVGVPALFANIQDIIDLTSIGTLFSFAIVCAGISYMELTGSVPNSRFKIPYISSAKIAPAIILCIAFTIWQNDYWGIIFTEKIFFLIVILVVFVVAIVKKLSLIPILGLICNLYLMSELSTTSQLRFVIWLIIGLAVYFMYSIRHSKLNARKGASDT